MLFFSFFFSSFSPFIPIPSFFPSLPVSMTAFSRGGCCKESRGNKGGNNPPWLNIFSLSYGIRRLTFFFWFGGILGSASRAKFPVSQSNHVGFTPRLLHSSTHHSPESFTLLKTGWAQDAWLQWSYENWYFHLDISRWPVSPNESRWSVSFLRL